MSQERNAQATDVALLKRALDMQKQTAQTMISAITPTAALPSHLGQNVNVVA